MELRGRRDGPVAVLDIVGRFDAHTAPAVGEWLTTTIADGQSRIAVNLAGVAFLDSTALGTLVRGLKRCRERQGDLHLCGLQRPVQVVLELTRLDSVFKTFPDEDAAVRAFGG
jgi:anti-sigma B factor antagonist